MDPVEKMIAAAGGVLIRNGKHKIYEVLGERVIVSHGTKSRRTNTNKWIIRIIKKHLGDR